MEQMAGTKPVLKLSMGLSKKSKSGIGENKTPKKNDNK